MSKCLTVVFLLLAIALTRGTEFHASPVGSVGADGSSGRPWDLRTALHQPPAVKPGDTIWLRGGVYRGTYSSTLSGTADQPIVVRAIPGQRAIIDGGDSDG